MEQWDFTAAYVNAPLDEPVFGVQPIGHEDTANPYWICMLIMALYGLRQSGWAWQKELRAMLKHCSAKPLDTDPATFLLREGTGWLIMPTHVDDCFPVFNTEGRHLRDRIFNHLSSLVKITCEGEIHSALKTRIHRDRSNGIMKISHESFVWEMLTRFEMLKCKEFATPGDPNIKLSNPDEVTDEMVLAAKEHPIREALGCLGWLAIMTRPDIAAATRMASSVQHKPSEALWSLIKRIMGYVKSTAHWGIVFRQPSTNDNSVLALDCFVDVSFAPDIHINKARSRIGYCLRLYGSTTTWCTQMTTRPLSSSSEAECAGLHEAIKEVKWQRMLHNEIGFLKLEGPTICWEDNTAAITLAGAKEYHARSRHFGIEWHSVKHDVADRLIEPIYISTEDQLADMLTKTLASGPFVHLRDQMMGHHTDQLYFGTLFNTSK